MIPELDEAIKHIENIIPDIKIKMVVINTEQQWLFFDEDYICPIFPQNVDTSILEKALDAVYALHGFPYIYQKN